MKDTPSSSLLIGKGLPNFGDITPIEIEENMPYLLKELNSQLTALEKGISNKLSAKNDISWDELIKPLNKIEEKLLNSNHTNRINPIRFPNRNPCSNNQHISYFYPR